VELTLTGPEGVDPTNLGTPHLIYTEMLKGIKKYFQDYQPEGLYFFGMNAGMDLVYASFVKRFLGDGPGKDPRFVFIRLDDSHYIRKDIYERLPPEKKVVADRSLDYWRDEEARYMKDRLDQRQSRMAQRRPTPPQPAQPTPQEPTESIWSFKNFTRLVEIGEIENDNGEGLNFQDYGDYVQCPFEVAGNYYRTTFERCNITTPGLVITNKGVSITFSGPNGLRLTNIGNSHAVYTQMLRAIKKYLQDYQPEGLHFFGMDNAMDLTYAAFVKRFLGDRPGKDPRSVFIKISHEDYIRKDAYENLPPRTKSIVDQQMLSWKGAEEDYLQGVQNSKRRQRQQFMQVKNQAGTQSPTQSTSEPSAIPSSEEPQ
jgi:hypothetical protein